MLIMDRSVIHRVAVDRTIRRGVEMYEKIHGPATPETVERIRRFVVLQAEILNRQGKLLGDEIPNHQTPLYQGRQK